MRYGRRARQPATRLLCRSAGLVPLLAVLCAGTIGHAAPDRWTNDGPALTRSLIENCIREKAEGCALASYKQCAEERGTGSEVDIGYCVRIAHEAWLEAIRSRLAQGSSSEAQQHKIVGAWSAWADQMCRMKTKRRAGGTSRSRLLVSCKIELAEDWLRYLTK